MPRKSLTAEEKKIRQENLKIARLERQRAKHLHFKGVKNTLPNLKKIIKDQKAALHLQIKHCKSMIKDLHQGIKTTRAKKKRVTAMRNNSI